MRKCVIVAMAMFAVLTFSVPSQASAQGVFLGAGASFPTGDFKDIDEAKTGWLAEAGLSFPVGENGLAVFVDGLYGSNSHDHDGESTDLLGGFGGVEYVFAEEGAAGPFVFGEIGFLKHSFNSDEYGDESKTGLAFGGGVGYSFPIGGMSGYVLGRYLQGQLEDEEEGWGNTSLFGLMGGVSIPLGGS